MTNLIRWLFYIGLFAVPYLAIVLRKVESSISDAWMFEIQMLPLIIVIVFGIYAATTVLYRVFTFNDCPVAAKEIQKQIKEAREDLVAKGFKFRD